MESCQCRDLFRANGMNYDSLLAIATIFLLKNQEQDPTYLAINA